MAAFGKACGANQVIGDPVALADIPATIDISNGGVCDGSADITIANAAANAFTAENIGGVRCGGDAIVANGTSNTTCTLTVDTNGTITGAWTP